MPDDENTTASAEAPPQGLKGLPTATIEEDAGQMAGAAPQAAAGQGSTAAAPVQVEPTDKWGRTFNPEWHSAHPDGSPWLSRSDGLMKKPGTPDPDLPVVRGPKRRAAAKTGTQRSVAPPAPTAEAPAASEATHGFELTETETPTADAPTLPVAPAMTPEEKQAAAKIYADLNSLMWRLAGKLFGGPDPAQTAEEKQNIWDSAYMDSLHTGRKFPFGYFLINIIYGFDYLTRVIGGVKKLARDAGASFKNFFGFMFGRKKTEPEAQSTRTTEDRDPDA